MALLQRLSGGSTGSRGGKRSDGEGPLEAGTDAVRLVVDYVKQETLDPVKSLGRFVAFGVAGSLLLATGLVLLLVAVLRVLQSQTGSALTGNLSWVPYGCVAVLALLLMGLAAWRVAKGPATRRKDRSGTGSGGRA